MVFSAVEMKTMAKSKDMSSSKAAIEAVKASSLSNEQKRCCWAQAIACSQACKKKTVQEQHVKYILIAVEKCCDGSDGSAGDSEPSSSSKGKKGKAE